MSKKNRKKSEAPKSASEQIEVELVKSALDKRSRGERPNQREVNALKRWEKEKEEKQRWQFYATVPKSHYVEMSGRQPKVINEQARRYNLPLRGRTIDLPDVIYAIHDLLAKYGRKLVMDDDPMSVAVNSPALEKYREERAKLARMDRLEREKTLLPRDWVHEGLSRIASILRQAGELLEQNHGPDAKALLDKALDNAVREVDALFAGDSMNDDREPTEAD